MEKKPVALFLSFLRSIAVRAFRPSPPVGLPGQENEKSCTKITADAKQLEKVLNQAKDAKDAKKVSAIILKKMKHIDFKDLTSKGCSSDESSCIGQIIGCCEGADVNGDPAKAFRTTVFEECAKKTRIAAWPYLFGFFSQHLAGQLGEEQADRTYEVFCRIMLRIAQSRLRFRTRQRKQCILAAFELAGAGETEEHQFLRDSGRLFEAEMDNFPGFMSSCATTDHRTVRGLRYYCCWL